MQNLNHNIEFVKTVQKYPYLWKTTLPEYGHKDLVAHSWKAVSEEMSQSIPICRKQWQTIRKGLRDRLRKCDCGGNSTRKYYLSEYLEFLMPYLKFEHSTCKHQRNLNENITNVENAVNDQQNITATRINEDETVEISDEESLKSNKSSSEHTTTPIQVQILNGKQNDTANNDDSGIYVQCRVRKKKAKTAEVNGKQSFLNSLLPYLREMTGKQNRRFRQKVVALIDEILDDADIPQMILPSISTRDSPVSSHLPGISYERHFRSVNEHTTADLGQLN